MQEELSGTQTGLQAEPLAADPWSWGDPALIRFDAIFSLDVQAQPAGKGGQCGIWIG